MKAMHKKLLLAGAYVLTFAAAYILTCVIENWGLSSAEASLTALRMPSVYVRYGEHQVNEMHAYTSEIDGGYLRESIVALEKNGSGATEPLLLGVRAQGQEISAIGYRLSNSANEYVVEEGTLTAEDSAEGVLWYTLNFQTPPVADREYCLTLILTDTQGTEYYYYTRLITGEAYRLEEKLDFVWDFNRKTRDPNMSAQVGSYLETSGLNDNMTFANIDIYSTTASVMWGGLTPSLNGNAYTTIKAISPDAATISLDYKIQLPGKDNSYTEYYVDEYYTIQWREDTYLLKDFRRSLSAVPVDDQFEVSGDMLKLGIVDEESLSFMSGITHNGDAAVFTMDGKLWYYDIADNIMTCVIAPAGTVGDGGFAGDYPYGIKALQLDKDGILYFIVYGYMPTGMHEGENGIAVYEYSPENNRVREQAFIASKRGYEVLKMNVGKLAFMNDEHELYLCLDGIVYRIDYEHGQAREVIEQLDLNNYRLSADGTMLAVPASPDVKDNAQILVYYLETGEEKVIQDAGRSLKLLGFFENDLVYGTADAQRIFVDGDGSSMVPMDKICILDKEMNLVREYTSPGEYIMDVKLDEATVNLSLAKAVQKNGKTVYEYTEGDYLVNNPEESQDKVSLAVVYDDTLRNEMYISVKDEKLSQPLTQTAVMAASDPSVFEIEPAKEPGEKYYLYTGDGLYRDYASLLEAVAACDKATGVVVSENKQIVWQKSFQGASARLDLEAIRQGDVVSSVTQAIGAFAEGLGEVKVDAGMSLREALDANLTKHQTVSLRGMSLDDVLYFVYSGRPVIAQLRADEFVIIVGYNDDYLQIADPSTGEIGDWNRKVYEDIFEEQGNIFLSYY